MEFKYNSRKTIQAACLFLKLHDRPMEYMRLLKLLYLADKKALDHMGETITGDRYVSMNHGPVLSRVYDLINHGPKGNPGDPWFDFISPPEKYLVRHLEDPGTDDLCEEEEEIIENVFAFYGKIDLWNLSELTHLFPEWQYPHGSAVPIRVEDILRGLGKPEEEIKEIQAEIESKNYLDLIFDSTEALGIEEISNGLC